MNNTGKSILARARERAIAKGYTGYVAQMFAECFIEGFIEGTIQVVCRIMKLLDKTYCETALFLGFPTEEMEFYRPLFQAYVTDRKEFQTLLAETAKTIMCQEAEEEENTEDE